MSLAAVVLADVQVRDAATPARPASGAESISVDDLWVRGAIHVLDETGREVAFLGRERGTSGEGDGSGPIVLGLYSPSSGDGGPEQTLRLATSESGSAISVRTPDGRSSMTLLAGATGPEVELRQGARHRVISAKPDPGQARLARSSGRALPAVGTASGSDGQIDLSLSDVQEIGHGFMVVNLLVEERPDGVLVSGRMINGSSVPHTHIEFELALAGQSKSFHITRISPGNSTGFSVALSDVSVANSGTARIQLVRSTLSYFGHSLKGFSGQLTARR